jgi:metal-responsive CopG/Arc/MetJ family transcriptional regulator
MKTRTIGVRVHTDFIVELDTFRRSEPDLPSRAEGLRRLAKEALSGRAAREESGQQRAMLEAVSFGGS